MKHFLSVIGQLAIWQPPSEITAFTFSVDSTARQISYAIRACCFQETGVFAHYLMPEHVHQLLNSLAVHVIKRRDEVHAEREGSEEPETLREANAVFLAGIEKHLKSEAK